MELNQRYCVRFGFFAALIVWLFASSVSVAAQTCRQALLLALDVSLSVDPLDFTLQREGLSRALLDAEVQNAMIGGSADHIELAIYEWSGQFDQTLLVDWTVIDSPATLQRLALSLLSSAQQTRSGRTALGAALAHARELLIARSHCQTLTLDVSGDGMNNSGIGPEIVRGDLEALGIVINGLVIEPSPLEQNEEGPSAIQLSQYFHDYVIAGPSAFVETIFGFENYEEAIKRKLLRELIPSMVSLPDSRIDTRAVKTGAIPTPAPWPPMPKMTVW